MAERLQTELRYGRRATMNFGEYLETEPGQRLIWMLVYDLFPPS